MGQRRKARKFALQGLYIFDIRKVDLAELETLNWVESEINEDTKNFTLRILTSTITNIEEIDKYIIESSNNWKFERMTSIDKSILRQSISEMLYMEDIPHAVTINEAIELAKIYGGDNSTQFINGILDAVKKVIT
jgi:transcription antitermination protein NusB